MGRAYSACDIKGEAIVYYASPLNAPLCGMKHLIF